MNEPKDNEDLTVRPVHYPALSPHNLPHVVRRTISGTAQTRTALLKS